MRKFDAIVVLGFDVTQEGVTPAEGKSRVDRAIEILSSGASEIVIFSGAVSHLHNYKPRLSEAESMKQYAISRGVAKQQIITETVSKNTYENAVFCKKIIDTHKWRSVVVVTSEFHHERAQSLFKKVFGNTYRIEFRLCENRLSVQEQKLINEMEVIKARRLHGRKSNAVNKDEAHMQRLLAHYIEQRTTS